jgi:hypothetical protein
MPHPANLVLPVLLRGVLQEITRPTQCHRRRLWEQSVVETAAVVCSNLSKLRINVCTAQQHPVRKGRHTRISFLSSIQHSIHAIHSATFIMHH